MSVFSTAAKNDMLDALAPDEIRLHNGDPGAAGTSNRVGGTDGEETASFSAAASGARALATAVEFTGLTPALGITWISVWDTSGTPLFLGKAELSGDTAANSEGEFTVTTATELRIDDPA